MSGGDILHGGDNPPSHNGTGFCCESGSPDNKYVFEVDGCEVISSRVCNRLSGYSGYSDIRKNLSVRIVI